MRVVRKISDWHKARRLALGKAALSEAVVKLTAAESDFQTLMSDVQGVLMSEPRSQAVNRPAPTAPQGN